MKFTPEDLEKLQTKQLANIIRKLNDGKTLTAREQAILAAAREDGAAAEAPASGYAKNWSELATASGVDRRTLTNVRERHAVEIKKLGMKLTRTDGRHVVAEWIRFLDEKGVRGRGLNNPETRPEDYIDERQLRLQRERFQLEKAKFELKCAKEQMVLVVHVEAALGAMLASFRQSLDSLPGRIASGIDEADRAELLAVLVRAEKQKLSYKKLRSMVERGQIRPFADVHARRAFVESEIDQVQRVLSACEYLEADPDAEEDEE